MGRSTDADADFSRLQVFLHPNETGTDLVLRSGMATITELKKNLMIFATLTSFLLLALSSFASAKEPPSSRMSPSERNQYNLFKAETESHILRVTAFGLALLSDPDFLNKFPEYRALAIQRDVVLDILLEHDATKIRESTQLGRLGFMSISDPHSIPRQLARFRGIHIDSLPNTERESHRALIDELDRIDKEHIEKTLKLYGLSPAEQQLFAKLEEAVDKSDRYLAKANRSVDPEFNKKMIPASEWILVDPYDHRDQAEKEKIIELAKYIESRKDLYVVSTEGLTESYYTRRRLNSPRNYFVLVQESLVSRIDPGAKLADMSPATIRTCRAIFKGL